MQISKNAYSFPQFWNPPPPTPQKRKGRKGKLCVRVTGITPLFLGGGKCAKCSNIFGTKCPSIPHTAETIHANSGDFAVCIQGGREGEKEGGEKRKNSSNADPGSGAFLTPGSWIRDGPKNPDPKSGSGMNITYYLSQSLDTVFRVKNT